MAKFQLHLRAGFGLTRGSFLGTTAIADMDDYINKMGDLAGQAGFEYMADCETALTDIRDTQIPAADTHKVRAKC